MNRNILAIDIGSQKVSAVIAEYDSLDELKIIGTGFSTSNGFKKGTFTNIELAAKSVKQAINEAKRVSGTELKSAIVSISGTYAKYLDASGIINIPNKEISIKEIERVMNISLYNAKIPNEYEVLHALPYNFKVDDQDYIEDPLGMNASRLEVEVHIITVQKSSLNNLRKAVRGAGVEVDNIVLSGYASTIAVLNEDERELGAGVIDMGATTSNLIIYSGNSIRYNAFLGVGSDHITKDLSMALHTPLNVAENVKIMYGSLSTEPNSDLIELPIIGDESTTHEMSLDVVHSVIYARVEETLMILASHFKESGLKEHMGAGIVLTGGYTKLDGLRELAVALFDGRPVRIASPIEISGLSDNLKGPEFATVVGLIKYAASGYTLYEIDVNKRIRYRGESSFEEHRVHLEDISRKDNFKNNDLGEKNSSNSDLPVMSSSDIKNELASLPQKNGKSSDEANSVTKFWNWATQLF